MKNRKLLSPIPINDACDNVQATYFRVHENMVLATQIYYYTSTKADILQLRILRNEMYMDDIV